MTRARVKELKDEGLGVVAIARQLGLSRSTVAYHFRRLGVPPDTRFNRRYDWGVIQEYYDAGHSITECQLRFGFSRETWNSARLRGAVVSRPQATPIENILIAGRSRNRSHVKMRLLGAGLKEDRCEACGLRDWRGRPLSMALHHINGDGQDNRLENLQLLCPNCHSQTENFSGRAKSLRNVARAGGS